MTQMPLLDLIGALGQTYEQFAWSDWKRVGEHMVSPGGRKLKYETWRKLSANTDVPDAAAPKPKDAGPTAPVAEDQVKTPDAGVAAQIADRLRAGQPVTAKELFALADKAYGGTRAAGKYGPSEAYDALEAGVNMALKGGTDPRVDAAGAVAQANNLLADLVRQLPTQTNRSGTKDQLQQFSTPPHYAYAAAWLANLTGTDVVLEPSAGTGSLAVHAANAGATVVANEIDPRRAALLKGVTGGAVYGENAEQIGAILNGKVLPTAVVMNPPFSNSLNAGKDQQTAAKHIDQALQLLAPGGRLVAIVGRGMASDSPTFRKWFAGLLARGYTLRADVGVDGKEYAKYGTAFGTRTLVIDKVAEGGAAVKGDVATVAELFPLLEGVRNGRPEPVANAPGGGAGGGNAQAVTSGAAAVREPVRAADGVLGDGTGGRPGAGGAGGSAAQRKRGVGVVPAGAGPGKPGAGDGRGAGGGGAAAAGGAGPADAAGRAKPGGGKAAAGKPGRQPEAAVPQLRPAAPVRVTHGADLPTQQSGTEDSVYDGYRPAARIAGAKPHPTPLVESSAMASIPAPKATYTPTLSPDVIESGLLSDAQLESVVYAGQAHQGFLPADEQGVRYRRGYFIGDGTGVGKGREIAGVIADNWNQGRKKHVWLSENAGLLPDSVAYLKAVGQDPKKVFPFDKLKGETPPGDGVLFVPYATLASRPKAAEAATNLQRIVDWLGADFDGVIAFDESHNMANSTASAGPRGKSEPSQRALAGVELQKLLPNARVMYVSATGATEVANLGYADRLGIWGKGTPFPTKQAFTAEMQSGGVAAMEAVAQSLKASGSYTARSLSLDGGTPDTQVTYDRLTHSLSEDQKVQYDAAADGWQTVLQNIDKALEATGGSNDRFARAAAKSQFWGAQQRFFNQMMTSMQTPSVIGAMKADLAEGRAPVVQLVNTMEAATKRAVGKTETPDDLENLDVSPREILMSYLDRSFPTQRYEQYTDEEGNARSRPVLTAAGEPVHDPGAVALKEEMMSKLGSLRIPSSPLDQIIDHFGHDQVAEVTGRGERLVYKTMPNGEVKRVLEKRNVDAAKIAESSAFQAGKKKILVFSDAGGTGKSYHADRTAGNQAKRTHYLLQPGWRADKAVQGLGRTHRANQAVTPHYRLVEIDQLKAQKRFVSTIARRLDQLGALTRGQRQAGSSGLFKAADNLESHEARQALSGFFYDLSRNRIPDLPFKETMNQLGFATEDKEGRAKPFDPPPMSQFLNRLLSLRVDKQAKVFDEFDTRLKKQVEDAAAAGTLDQGVENYKADKLERQGERVVFTHPETGAETKLLTVRATRAIPRTKFPEPGHPDLIGYFRNTETGKVRAAFKWNDRTEENGTVTPQVGMRGPTGLDPNKPRPYELTYGKQWEKIETPEAARALWAEQTAELPRFDESEEAFLTGSLLPIWDRIPKSDAGRIYRVKTAEGSSAVGRLVPSNQVATLLKNLGQTVDAKTFDIPATHARLEAGHAHAVLANGWKVKPVRVQGERRLELIGPSLIDQPGLTADGVVRERIQYDTRLFIPTGAAGADVLRRVVQHRPIVEVQKVQQFSQAAGGDDDDDGDEPFEAFAWADWRPAGPNHMQSPGGRVLRNETFRQMASQAAEEAEPNRPERGDKPAGGKAAPAAPEPWQMTRSQWAELVKGPPVPEGYVRLYRGAEVGSTGKWFSPDREEVAEMFAGDVEAEGKPAEIVYVDIPKDRSDEYLEAAIDANRRHNQGGAEGEQAHYLPAEVVAKAKHLKPPGSHEFIVRDALESGKPVPPEVLAEYPELAARYSEAFAWKDWPFEAFAWADWKPSSQKPGYMESPSGKRRLKDETFQRLSGQAAGKAKPKAEGKPARPEQGGKPAAGKTAAAQPRTVSKIDTTPAEKERTIDDAARELSALGIGELQPGGPGYDLKNKTARYSVKKPDGTVAVMTPDQITVAIREAKATAGRANKITSALGGTPPPEPKPEERAAAQAAFAAMMRRVNAPAPTAAKPSPLDQPAPGYDLARALKQSAGPAVTASPPNLPGISPAGAKPKNPGRLKQLLAKVAAGAKKVDSKVGQKVGGVGQKLQGHRRSAAAKVSERAAAGHFGKLVKWLHGSEVGRAAAIELERRAKRVDATARDMAGKGFVRGQAAGAQRAIRYFHRKFSENRRRYGTLAAVGIEAATFLLTKGIPIGLTLGFGAGGALLGNVASPVGAGAGAIGGLLLGEQLAKRFLKRVAGPLYAKLARATVEVTAGKLAAAVTGRTPSAVRLRKRGKVKAAATHAPTVFDSLPRFPAAAMSEGEPDILGMAAEVRRNVASRIKLMGSTAPVPTLDATAAALERAFAAMVPEESAAA